MEPLLIGPSLCLENSLYETLANNPYYTCQFTLTRGITKADKEATKLHCEEEKKRFYIHTNLICNLAKDDVSSSLREIKKDLTAVKGLPAAAVLHVGKAVDQTKEGKRPSQDERSKALDNIIKRLNSLSTYTKTDSKPILLLENAAGQGRELGDNWDDFRKISEGLDKNYLGVCIDTQHIFAAGLTEWTDYIETNKIMDEIKSTGFPVELIHLNDSAVPYSGKVDRHASIGKGFIWGKNTESLIELLSRCAEEKRSIVLETPTVMEDLKYIYDNFVV